MIVMTIMLHSILQCKKESDTDEVDTFNLKIRCSFCTEKSG